MPGREVSRRKTQPPAPREAKPVMRQAPLPAQPVQAQPSLAAPRAILALQRQYGNRAVQGLVPPKSPAGAPRSPAAVGASARITASATAGLLQLKPALVASNTSTRILGAPLTDKGPADSKAIAKSPRGRARKKLDSVELAEGSAPHIRDEGGGFAWYRLQGPTREYILAAKVIGGLAAAPPAAEEAAEAPSFDTLDYAGTMTGKVDDYLVDHIRGISLAGGTASAELVRGESFTWAGAGLLGMAVGLRGLFTGEASAWDRVTALFSTLSSTASTAGAAAQLASTFYDSKSAEGVATTTTGAWMFAYADMFATLANGVKTLKAVVDLVKMAVGDEKHTKAAYLQTGADVLTNGLETAKGVLRTIRGINEALAGGTVGAQFQQVIPGFDIAIAAVKTITQGYYLIVSAVEWKRMNKRKAALKEELAAQNYTPEQIKAALQRYKSEEALSAKLGYLLVVTEAKLEALRAKRDQLDPGETAKREALDEKIRTLEAKRRDYAGRKDAHDRTSRREEGRDGPTRKELEELDLSGDLALANKRRVTRQAVHISTNLAQIAGAIATLVSGPGAPAALSLKLAAAGVDASLPLFRWIKQKGRDTAAANLAKGETGLSNRIFNADKSSAAKLAARKKQAVVILMMVHNLNDLIPRSDDRATRVAELEALKAQMRRVEAYIGASGCPPDKLYAAAGKPDEQISILVKELSRRELG